MRTELISATYLESSGILWAFQLQQWWWQLLLPPLLYARLWARIKMKTDTVSALLSLSCSVWSQTAAPTGQPGHSQCEEWGRDCGAWRPQAWLERAGAVWPSRLGLLAVRLVVAKSCFSREVRNLGYYVKSPSSQARTVKVNLKTIALWATDNCCLNGSWKCSFTTSVRVSCYSPDSPRFGVGGRAYQLWAKITCQSVCNCWLLNETHRICVKLGVGRAGLNVGAYLFSDHRGRGTKRAGEEDGCGQETRS